LIFLRLTQRLRAWDPAVIAASGHLSPRLAELTGFLLAATALGTQRFEQAETGFAAITDLAQETVNTLRKLLKNT